MNGILAALETLPRARVGVAALLTIASFTALSGYELLALSYAGSRLSFRRVTFATWVTYGLGQSLGFPVVAGGAVRARVYSRWGIDAGGVARIIGFGAITTWLGVLSVLAVAFLWKAGVAASVLPVSPLVALAVGGTAMAFVLAYLGHSFARRPPIRIGRHLISFPPPRVAFAQVALAAADWLLAASVLYVLLPDNGMPFPAFLALFCAAQVAGLVSHVPGGLGVFDGIILAGIIPRSGADAVAVLASLTAFRGVYYVAPLAIGGGLLAWSECSAVVSRFGARVRALASTHATVILAVATFIAGAMLVFSSATPAVPARTLILEQVSFSPVTESAYFLSSLVGLALLFTSRGMYRRLDGAYVLALPLLVMGVIFSILKGLDYEEALVLAALLAGLVPARRHFSRHASLLAEPFTFSWVLSIAVVLACALWLAIFSSTHVLFSSTAWSHFAFTGGTPVSLGATVAAVCITAMISGSWLLRTVAPPLMRPSADEEEHLREAVAGAARTPANLALVGDKGILFSDDRKAFLMYGISGRTWASMGDPVGPPDARAELARRFRNLAAENGGRAVFYLVAPENLATYVDLGFSAKKVGETALVSLASFSLEGGSRKSLRRARNTALSEGCQFSVLPAQEVPDLLPALRGVSDSWLASKGAKEKGFSLGYFDERYLSQCPVALVRQNGQVIAFANIWECAEARELSVDLMRYSDGAPAGIMDFLLSEIMLWGKSRGYRSFDLGMAPLSGLETDAGSPVWQRIAGVLSKRGNRFYNFAGVRKYKEKFDPTWEGRYTVIPAGLHPTVALADVARLVVRLHRQRPNKARLALGSEPARALRPL